MCSLTGRESVQSDCEPDGLCECRKRENRRQAPMEEIRYELVDNVLSAEDFVRLKVAAGGLYPKSKKR